MLVIPDIASFVHNSNAHCDQSVTNDAVNRLFI